MIIWVTADTHFGHGNIIKHCDRPFGSVDEMDLEMMSRWNERVKPGDQIWHLGDVLWSRKQDLGPLFSRLNGDKALLLGNHDQAKAFRAWGGVWAVGPYLMTYKGRSIWMDHYPPSRATSTPLEGSVVLAGHQHNSLPWQARFGHRGNQFDARKMTFSPWFTSPWIDVGVDAWDYAPVKLDDLIQFWDENILALKDAAR